MHLPSFSPSAGGTNLQKKLEAALILRGVIRLRIDGLEVPVEPRTWYRESGEHYFEGRRRDSGEHLKIRVSEIREVLAY